MVRRVHSAWARRRNEMERVASALGSSRAIGEDES